MLAAIEAALCVTELFSELFSEMGRGFPQVKVAGIAGFYFCNIYMFCKPGPSWVGVVGLHAFSFALQGKPACLGEIYTSFSVELLNRLRASEKKRLASNSVAWLRSPLRT